MATILSCAEAAVLFAVFAAECGLPLGAGEGLQATWVGTPVVPLTAPQLGQAAAAYWETVDAMVMRSTSPEFWAWNEVTS